MIPILLPRHELDHGWSSDEDAREVSRMNLSILRAETGMDPVEICRRVNPAMADLARIMRERGR